MTGPGRVNLPTLPEKSILDKSRKVPNRSCEHVLEPFSAREHAFSGNCPIMAQSTQSSPMLVVCRDGLRVHLWACPGVSAGPEDPRRSPIWVKNAGIVVGPLCVQPADRTRYISPARCGAKWAQR